MAQGAVVVLAGLDHEPLVAGGEGGVQAAGVVSGQQQRLAQHRVTGLGGAAVLAGDA
jgi:hypothetical protein